MGTKYGFQIRVRDSYGNVIADENISVYLAGTTTPANIYSTYTATTGTSATPQLTSNSNGYAQLFVDPDDYVSGLAQLFDFDVEDSDVDYTYLDIFKQGTSTDGTLSGNSNSVVPTEKAVKSYVDDIITKSITYNNTDTTINLTTSNLNSVLLVDNAAAVTVNLPSVDSSDVGKWIQVHKMGIGNINIVRADSDTIEDGTTVSNTTVAETWVNITLFLARETTWKFYGSPLGTWSTT